jgi:hypothetical protein
MPDYRHYAALLGVHRLGRRSNWDSCPWILANLHSLLECDLDYGRAGLEPAVSIARTPSFV